MTGFEPATLRPPDVYATGLRHTPNAIFENLVPKMELQIKLVIYNYQKEKQHFFSVHSAFHSPDHIKIMTSLPGRETAENAYQEIYL